jgi:hypothetical protein
MQLSITLPVAGCALIARLTFKHEKRKCKVRFLWETGPAEIAASGYLTLSTFYYKIVKLTHFGFHRGS